MFQSACNYINKYKRGFEYMSARAPLLNRGYWRYAPKYYRWRIRTQVDNVAPLDPLKIVWVDPNCVSKCSGRKDATKNRWQDIGKIREGDWDRSAPQGPTGVKRKHLQGVSSAAKIEETEIYSSFEKHFKKDISWEETPIFQSMMSAIDNGVIVWRGCQSRGDILDRCHEIDLLYNRIKDQGYKSQYELFQQHGINTEHIGCLDLLADEVTVDIARDGELLFVDGRHRLCLAKILDVKTIPIVILVRHREWFKRREEIYNSQNQSKIMDHPDLNEAAVKSRYRMLQI